MDGCPVNLYHTDKIIDMYKNKAAKIMYDSWKW